MAVLWSSSLAQGTWRPEELDRLSRLSWWLACVFWATASAAFGVAAYPWLGRACTDRVTYFGDVSRLTDDLSQLSAALRDSAAAPLDVLLAELAWTGRTAMRKYQLVRVGFAAIGLAVAGMLIALL
ncbi:Pycsar system effector family protein [Micromonospora sp. WMMD736]|uniref:Pycsar system effector family protein n=1 Tax=Micromonospora sp. WMMD736 TaxID=3404112 RepID=UPI003B9663E5